MSKSKYFPIFISDFQHIELLTIQQRGELFTALFQYAETGNKPDISDRVVNMAFSFLSAQIQRHNVKYAEKCERNRENINARWNKKSDNGNTTVYDRIPQHTKNTKARAKSKTIARENIAPALDEIKVYVSEKEYTFSPEKFFNHYSALNWKKHGDIITDWRALADCWEIEERQRAKADEPDYSGIPNF